VSELGTQRHHARERALEIAYEATMKDRPVTTVLNEQAVRPDDYAVRILTSYAANETTANELISEFSVDWPLERIAIVDRLIMALAVGEMLMDDAPPVAVVLDESVELAKVYSTEGSGSFVNGVLSSISKSMIKR
jgi:N utilization substance protein B